VRIVTAQYLHHRGILCGISLFCVFFSSVHFTVLHNNSILRNFYTQCFVIAVLSSEPRHCFHLEVKSQCLNEAAENGML